MRSLVFVSALALLGCGSAPPASGPSNKAAAPDYAATADDVLGFLPVDAEFVVGLDLVTLRRSQLWLKFEPQIMSASGVDMAKFKIRCSRSSESRWPEKRTQASTWPASW
jgi:hypothetical protein